MTEFPKWAYSASGSVLLKSREEEDALIGTWCDSPAKVPMLKDEPEKVEPVAIDEFIDLTATQDEAADISSPEVSTDHARPKLGRPFKAK